MIPQIRPTEKSAQDPKADGRAWNRAIDVIVDELTASPVTSRDPEITAAISDWSDNAIQQTVITSTTQGIYNTPVSIYALHSCDQDKDFYLVNTGGDWTPTEARYNSASQSHDQIRVDRGFTDITVDWQDNDDYCTGGIAIFDAVDSRICRYMNYPLDYKISILPPTNTTTVQTNASPEGSQGQSTSYRSGFSFSLGGSVNISGDGPTAGLQAGVTWSQSVQTTVPALVIHAGDAGNEGTFTQYSYCTAGTTVEDCTSTIQATGQTGTCNDYIIGDPQNGQTPDGRLSDLGQSDPASYGDDTSFEVTVNWEANLATSTSNLWWGAFPSPVFGAVGPTGTCDAFGCSCDIGSNTKSTVETNHTFKVPFPSTDCS